jgi:cytochrome c553
VRGKRWPPRGDKGKTQICATCHLAKLKGTDKIPPIAGRSPTYLLRQLLAFKNGTRRNEAAKQMDAGGRETRARGHDRAGGVRGLALSAK